MAYFTALGDDPYSLAMRKFINEGNILTDCIRTIEGKRAGLYVVHQENGDHQFPYWRENSAARLLADDTQALSSAIDGADCLYFSGITLAILEPNRRQDLLKAIGKARKNNVLVAFDRNIRVSLWPDKSKIIQTLRHAASVSDIVLPTFSDEATLFSDISQEQMNARLNGSRPEDTARAGITMAAAVIRHQGALIPR